MDSKRRSCLETADFQNYTRNYSRNDANAPQNDPLRNNPLPQSPSYASFPYESNEINLSDSSYKYNIYPPKYDENNYAYNASHLNQPPNNTINHYPTETESGFVDTNRPNNRRFNENYSPKIIFANNTDAVNYLNKTKHHNMQKQNPPEPFGTRQTKSKTSVPNGVKSSAISNVAFYNDPLSPSVHNEYVDKDKDEIQKNVLCTLSPAYSKLVSDNDNNARLKHGSVLLNSDIHKQVLFASSRNYRPFFMVTVVALQTFLLFYSYYLNHTYTGSYFDDGFPYLRQNTWTLTTMGARYYLCMRPSPEYPDLDLPFISQCPIALSRGSPVAECSIRDVCGIIPSLVPNQIYRFFTPIFLHYGILHFIFNVVFFQVFAGISIERDIGSLRMAFIYIVSGVGGFLFNPAELKPDIYNMTVGASGAIYGLISCILIDIIFSWRLLKNPVLELIKLIAKIILSLAVGYLLPGVDNFSHIGGLITGLLSSAIVLPSVYFGIWDRTGKFLLRIISIPLLILYFALNYYAFVNRYYFCPKCTIFTSFQ